MEKNLVSGPVLARLVQIRVTNFFFFFKNLASSVTRYHGQLSSCTISEKTNDPILRKRTDRWTRIISQDAVRLTSNVQYFYQKFDRGFFTVFCKLLFVHAVMGLDVKRVRQFSQARNDIRSLYKVLKYIFKDQPCVIFCQVYFLNGQIQLASIQISGYKLEFSDHNDVNPTNIPTNIYLFKFNNRNSRKLWKTCSKLPIKTTERCQ